MIENSALNDLHNAFLPVLSLLTCDELPEWVLNAIDCMLVESASAVSIPLLVMREAETGPG